MDFYLTNKNCKGLYLKKTLVTTTYLLLGMDNARLSQRPNNILRPTYTIYIAARVLAMETVS